MKSLRKLAIGPLLLLGLLAIGCFFSAGCQTATKQYTFSPIPDDGGHGSPCRHDTADQFAVGDLVTVRFSGTVDQIPELAARIKEDGTITLPLIGDVRAAGKTLRELQKEIHDLYVPRYYQRLTVLPPGGQPVYYVGGHVHSPGRQVYVGATTVTKAIKSAGGLTEFAGRATRVHLTRTSGKIFVINCVKAAKDPSLDLPVYPGDRIDVPMEYVPDYFRFE